MTVTIIRMFEGVRPFDWVMLVVEILVLLLITYEVTFGIVRHRKDEKRKRELASIVASLSARMDKGQSLQASVPDTVIPTSPQSSLEVVDHWMKSVEDWTIGTESFLCLGAQSSRAASAFMLIVAVPPFDGNVRKPHGWVHVHGIYRESYQRLLIQLDNLRGIMEKPDVYF